MQQYRLRNIGWKTGITLLLAGFAACSKMDTPYKDFIKGSVIYIGSADSVKVHPGKNRIQLSWLLSDPMATHAKVYWNNRSDSLEVPLKSTGGIDSVNVMLKDLPEGAYSFDIYTYDDKGHSSVRVSAVGYSYGDNYIGSLLPRPVTSAMYEAGDVNILWGGADETVVRNEFSYTDTLGVAHQVYIYPDSAHTLLKGYDFEAQRTLQYKTLYLPDPMSIDTFYTPGETMEVTTMVEYDKSAWTAEAVDYDVPSGRVPQNTLDNNPKTVWHMDKTHSYPHHITVDMKTVNEINGLSYMQRAPLDGAAKQVEIEISTDNASWESLGVFTLENSADKKFLELANAVSCRYFRITFNSDYKNGQFTAIAELGAYKRE
ncbi:DUF4998 domain-containing protein [Compostibacter hankyongensis]|uniref:F5/8 type C domain-containing protein n=1 Tax=Compostibacter hankyongensis TaxID=1007089 RepID=A0ABP8FD12_9BACT